jgi:hypothetical protein
VSRRSRCLVLGQQFCISHALSSSCPPPPPFRPRPQELAARTARGLPLSPLKALAGTPYEHCDGSVPCRFFHPGQTCAQHAVSILPLNYERALRVYLPVYVLPMLLVHRQQLLKQPRPILNKAAYGVARCGLMGATALVTCDGVL